MFKKKISKDDFVLIEGELYKVMWADEISYRITVQGILGERREVIAAYAFKLNSSVKKYWDKMRK